MTFPAAPLMPVILPRQTQIHLHSTHSHATRRSGLLTGHLHHVHLTSLYGAQPTAGNGILAHVYGQVITGARATFNAARRAHFEPAQHHCTPLPAPSPLTTIADGNQEHPLPFSQASPVPLCPPLLLTSSRRPSCCCPFQATLATTAKTTFFASTWRERPCAPLHSSYQIEK